MIRMRALIHHFYHYTLPNWILSVPSQDMASMPLFAIRDLPYLVIFPREWLKMVQRLATFQKNIRSSPWPDMSVFYPRMAMWVFAYCLFTWGDLTGQLETLLQTPDKAAIAEIFLRYVSQIDNYIDSFDSRHIWLKNPNIINEDPKVKWVTIKFHQQIAEQGIAPSEVANIQTLVNDYSQAALAAMQLYARTPQSLGEVVSIKNTTAGGLFACWSDILSQLYEVPQDLATEVSLIFFNFGMLIQVLDDVADAPIDYKLNALNLLVEIAKATPEESEKLQLHLKAITQPYLGWPWVRNHLPVTHRHILDLYEGYAEPLICDGPMTKTTRKMVNGVDGIRKMSR